MRKNFIFPLVCFIICVKALTYTAAHSISTPKAEVFERMLQATTHPTANDTVDQPTSEQHRYKSLKKVIHNKGGAVAGSGAAHSAPSKSRNGGCSLLAAGKPFSILSSTTGQIIVEFLVFVCLFRST